MIAGRKCQNATFLLLIIETRQGIECATEFECAYALKVLAFKKELCAGFAINRRRGEYRRAMRMPVNLSGS